MRPHRWLLAVCLSALLTSLSSTTCHADLFAIGNSLTNDVRVDVLEGNSQWDIFCSKNLQYIFDNPGDACVPTSTIWTDALANSQFDFVSVQPYSGTSLQEDVGVISQWMQLQPNAVFVIHTGWAPSATVEATYHSGNPNDRMRHSPEYFAALISELRALDPTRDIRSTHVIDVLDAIYHDIENGVGPFTDITELYRDDLHFNNAGQYLAHNLMRSTIGQPFIEDRFTQVDPAVKAYLLAKISAIPEASSLATTSLCAFAGLTLLALRRRRWRNAVALNRHQGGLPERETPSFPSSLLHSK